MILTGYYHIINSLISTFVVYIWIVVYLEDGLIWLINTYNMRSIYPHLTNQMICYFRVVLRANQTILIVVVKVHVFLVYLVAGIKHAVVHLLYIVMKHLIVRMNLLKVSL